MNIQTKVKLPSLTRDIEQCKRDMSEWGYCLLADVVSEEERKRLLDRVIEQAELECETGVAYLGGGQGSMRWVGHPAEDQNPPVWQSLTTCLNKGQAFIDLAKNAKLHDIAKHIWGPNPFDLSTMRALIQRKGCEAGAIHVDQILIPFTTPMPLYNNSMITLSDFTVENGATRVVPGSHKLNSPHLGGDPNAMEEVAMEAPAGSAIIWESRTWHRSAASSSDAVRYSISTVLGLVSMRQQDVYPFSMHDHVYYSLTEQERNMFGFMPIGFNNLTPRSPGDRGNSLPIKGGNPYVPELRRNKY